MIQSLMHRELAQCVVRVKYLRSIIISPNRGTPTSLFCLPTWFHAVGIVISQNANNFRLARMSKTFHPYFENLDTDRWLYCQVTVVGGVSLDFYINPPAGWAASQGARAERHFQVFKLREAFATYAATELSTAKFRLQTLFASGGAALVKDDLTLEAVSSGQAHLNSWKTAAYEALAQSDEFCDGGFENIAA